VRSLRESGERGPLAERRLAEVAETLERDHPRDWLLRLELVELEDRLPAGQGTALRARLAELAAGDAEHDELVSRGLALCN
jgi:hypothetical protein